MAGSRSSSKGRFGALVAAGAAVLLFPAAASAAVTSDVNGAGVLTVNGELDDAITITCDTNQVKINGDNPDNGAADCAAITAINVTGGTGANAITLTGVTAAAFANAEPVTIDGAAGNDTIAGSELVDTMRGGEGNDRILGDDSGPGTRDVFEGQDGDDTLVWNPGDDDDLMEGGAGTDTIEVNGGGGPEQFTVKPSATAGRVQFDRTGPTPPGPFNLDIGTAERLDMNAGGGDDTFTADPGLDALGFKLDVDGGDGNDTLDGGDGADLISGGNGNDRIVPDDNPPNTRDDARGDAGDDTIAWNGGDDDDLNEGGAGTDTIEVNGAGLPEEFTVKPSPVAGRVLFDRLTTPPGPFNIDIGTAERLDLNAGGGDDKVTADPGLGALALDVDGGDGNDSIDGSENADLLSGGTGNDRIVPDDNPPNTRDDARGDAGDDTMVWNGGDDDDLNEGGEGVDIVEVNGAAVGEQFTVKPSPVAGRVLFDRLGANPGPFSIDIGTSENLVVAANAGNDKIETSKGLAGRISGTFNGGDGNDRIEGTDSPDRLFGGKGLDLIRARDKAADQVECEGGFDLAFVDKRDLVRACEIVFGGKLRVKALSAKSLAIAGNAAALKLRCVGTRRCNGRVALVRNGKSLGSAKFKLTRRQAAKTVRIKLNRRGRSLLARARGKDMKVTLRIDARDGAGNGWRTSARTQLKR
jgi:Ca2+-binding RTX toxin-like protein